MRGSNEPSPNREDRPAIRGASGRRLHDGARDELVLEEPLVLQVDDDRLLTMRTPGQDVDFAYGFLRSEGLIERLDDVASIDFQKGIPLGEPGPPPDGDGHVADRLRIRLRAGARPTRTEALRRTHEIRPSCGICGIEELASLLPDGHLAPGRPRLRAATLRGALREFARRQDLFRATGGCHAAALVSPAGAFLGFGEDVGRHNALDKAIGQALRAGHDPRVSFGILSGRAGYELIAKLLRVGCPIIVSVSAASALAFDLCREAGATLIGFARGDALKVYWDEARLEAGR